MVKFCVRYCFLTDRVGGQPIALFSETMDAFFNRDGDHFVLCIAEGRVGMEVKSGSAQLFEGLNDRFSATVPVPGKWAAPEVTPEVTPEVASRLHR
jgi:hypothetical protein